ncbi:uncharacterized protein [Desmodus rotundus]|uniref:uncharacterized protein isoform X1 n=1 Tax=Desmodus rotundus TaxID=9430 RepID=UPI0039E31F76
MCSGGPQGPPRWSPALSGADAATVSGKLGGPLRDGVNLFSSKYSPVFCPAFKETIFSHMKSLTDTQTSNQCRFHCKEVAECLRWRWLWLSWNQKRRPGVSQWPAGGAHLISGEVGEGELEARKRSARGSVVGDVGK